MAPALKRASRKTKQKKRPAAKKPAARRPAPRADYGFFAKQPAHLRAILDELRKLVDEAAPDADSSLKWGMPFYTVGGTMMCGLGAHKSHVNLILSGPPGAFADPEGRLSGEGKMGRHLKLTTLDELPRKAVHGCCAPPRSWRGRRDKRHAVRLSRREPPQLGETCGAAARV
jgi:hypothetical protein